MHADPDDLERFWSELPDTAELLESMEQLTDPADLERQLAETAAICPLCLDPDRARCECPS
jgi:hypothetical protein